jgi:demethylmenaquinone methyltransferase / 2-methoxy-6-polyprenyl-1,4-benzoquinol methylase
MTGSAPSRVSSPGSRPTGVADEASASRHVREMFSRIAPRYDLLNHLLSLRFDVAWRNRLARRFRPLLARPDVRVLDLCCGTGDLALALAAEIRRAKPPSLGAMIGADFAHPMLMRAREKAEKGSTSVPIEFLEADALSLPFADQSFDLITTAFGFRNLANYEAGIAEFYRLLRPGGSVAILEFTEPESALFGAAYRFYFRHVLPRLGGIVSGSPQAYTYLPGSVARFPKPAELATLMKSSGFVEVDAERWTGGIVALHTAQRQLSRF